MTSLCQIYYYFIFTSILNKFHSSFGISLSLLKSRFAFLNVLCGLTGALSSLFDLVLLLVITFLVKIVSAQSVNIPVSASVHLLISVVVNMHFNLSEKQGSCSANDIFSLLSLSHLYFIMGVRFYCVSGGHQGFLSLI